MFLRTVLGFLLWVFCPSSTTLCWENRSGISSWCLCPAWVMLFILSLEAIMLYSWFILVFGLWGRNGLMVLYYSKPGIQALIVTRVFCRSMMSMRFIILHSKALGWEGKGTTFTEKGFLALEGKQNMESISGIWLSWHSVYSSNNSWGGGVIFNNYMLNIVWLTLAYMNKYTHTHIHTHEAGY